MKIVYFCETCQEEFDRDEFDVAYHQGEGLTKEEGEGIINNNSNEKTVNSLCSQCHEELYGEDSMLPYLKGPYKH